MSSINTSTMISSSERTQLMIGELQKLGIQPNMIMSQDNLYELFDRRVGGRTFDRGIAIQLYDRMQKDPYGNVSAAEFIKVYLEAEDALRSRMQQIEISINEYERQKTDVIEKLDVLKKEEVLNAYGVMQGSKLTIAIYEFQYITTPIPNYMFVNVTCEQQSLRTQIVEYQDRAVWQEEFELDIITGLDDIQLAVAGFNQDADNPHILGEVRISPSKLKDQQIHEESYDLFDRNGHLVGGKIRLGLQWIFSRVKYLNDVARKWDDHIRMHWDDKNDCEKDIKALYDLFPALKNAYPKVEQKSTMKPATTFTTHIQNTLSPIRHKLQSAPDDAATVSSQDIELEWDDMGFWGHFAIMSTIAAFILSLFACYFKADFVDLAVCVTFLTHCGRRGSFKGSPDRVYYLFLAAVGAIGLDVVWLILYSHAWNEIVRGSDVSPNVLNFVIVIKWFSLVAKAILALGYYRFSQVLRTSEGRTANIQLHHVRFSATHVKNY